MIRTPLRFLLLIITTSILLFSKANGQLIRTGLVEDLERNQKSTSNNSSSFRTASTNAVAYTDTLELPFFEDFSDVVVHIDSIRINNTTDSLVRIYDNALNSFPNGTKIFVGFTNTLLTITTKKITKNLWSIKKIGTNQFILDSSSALLTPIKINMDTLIKGALWRLGSQIYSNSLDTLKWASGGNVYINNRYPINPVSYNVATFDGLDANGVPYNTVDIKSVGFADNLTSLPINLKPYTAVDNLYLSFFWQQAGVGEVPDSTDYIQLEFRDTTGAWNVIKTISGNSKYLDTFRIEVIPISSGIYFSKKFQFRFRAFGRLSGAFDVWNIDHIYLNKNRSIYDTTFNDKTIGNLPVTFLKNYTAMPYKQFFANKTAESGDIAFTDNNLGRGLINTEFFNVLAEFSKQPANIIFSRDTTITHYPGDSTVTNSPPKGPPKDNIRTFQDSCTPNVSGLTNNGQPFYIDQTLKIPSNDTVNILYANNNHFKTRTIFWDYYSYDDESPEASVGTNQIGIKVANKYTVNLADTLTHVDIYFTRSIGPNLAGIYVQLSIWDQNLALLFKQAVQIKYGGYTRYKLASPVPIGAGMDFYIGYSQATGDLITVGYDKNYDHSDKVFFNLSGSSWDAYNQQQGYAHGSMMMRPVFSKNQALVLATDPEEKEQPIELVLYPIPVNDLLKIKGNATEITLYDFAGKKLASQKFNAFEDDKEINLANLANGLYIVELKIKDQTIIKKIIVQHD